MADARHQESDDLRRQAQDERTRSRHLRQGMSQDMPEEDRRHREQEAGRAEERATELDGRANALKHRGGLGEKEEAERDPERRAWALVGTSSTDTLQQMQEANNGPSLMGSLAAYGARGLVTRDGKMYGATKGAAAKLVGRSGDKEKREKTAGGGVMDEVRNHKAGRGQTTRQPAQERPERQKQVRQPSRGRGHER